MYTVCLLVRGLLAALIGNGAIRMVSEIAAFFAYDNTIAAERFQLMGKDIQNDADMTV
jgi:hypothetical protein